MEIGTSDHKKIQPFRIKLAFKELPVEFVKKYKTTVNRRALLQHSSLQVKLSCILTLKFLG